MIQYISNLPPKCPAWSQLCWKFCNPEMNAEYSTIISYVLVALQNHPANQDWVLGYRDQFDLSLMNSAFFFFFTPNTAVQLPEIHDFYSIYGRKKLTEILANLSLRLQAERYLQIQIFSKVIQYYTFTYILQNFFQCIFT